MDWIWICSYQERSLTWGRLTLDTVKLFLWKKYLSLKGDLELPKLRQKRSPMLHQKYSMLEFLIVTSFSYEISCFFIMEGWCKHNVQNNAAYFKIRSLGVYFWLKIFNHCHIYPQADVLNSGQRGFILQNKWIFKY